MADNSNLQPTQVPGSVPTSTTKEILTIEEAAEFLSVSKSYLYKQTSAQRIPHYKSSIDITSIATDKFIFLSDWSVVVDIAEVPTF